MNFFVSIWLDIVSFLTGTGKFLVPFLKTFLKDEAKVLKAAAFEAIANVNTTMPNAEWDVKLKAAVDYIIKEMADHGLQVAKTDAINMIQVLITDSKEAQAS